jgi:hypothetical protein
MGLRMTFIELGLVVLWLAGASLVSYVAGTFLGGPGFVLGFVGSVVGPFVLAGLHAFANPRLRLSPESAPACRCGESSLGFSHERHAAYSFVARCVCGRTYARRGGHVLLIEPGTARPYMKWVRFRGWQPCNEAWGPMKPYR